MLGINPQELHNQTRFIYGSLRIDSPEVKSCVNIPEIERCEQYEKMSSIRKWQEEERATTLSRSPRPNFRSPEKCYETKCYLFCWRQLLGSNMQIKGCKGYLELRLSSGWYPQKYSVVNIRAVFIISLEMFSCRLKLPCLTMIMVEIWPVFRIWSRSTNLLKQILLLTRFVRS